MKIYSWKTLLVTVLGGGMLIVYEIKNIIAGEMASFLFLILWSYLFIKGLWVSFTREGFESDRRDGDINKRVMEKLFGKWAFIAPWGGIILIVIGLAISLLMPSRKWLYILLVIVGLVYQVKINLLIRKHVKLERRKYF